MRIIVQSPDGRRPAARRRSAGACARLRAERGFDARASWPERAGLSARFLVQVEAGRRNISVRKLASAGRARSARRRPTLLSGPGGERATAR